MTSATEQQSTASRRRLEAASKHVSDLWIPPNPKLLEKIQTALADGAYDLNPTFFINDIKNDIGLFTHCLREVRNPEHYPDPSAIPSMDGGNPFKNVSLAIYKKIFTKDSRPISQHTFEGAASAQLSRLKETMITASTAELLCEQNDVESMAGFAAGIVRQLGLSLIAWNYPTVYRQALQSLKDPKRQKTLDEILSEQLGYSPELLASHLLSSWGYGDSLGKVVGADPAAADPMVDQLRQFCAVGEALARASDPQQYPTATRDWSEARSILEQELGVDGLAALQERVRDNCEQYRQLIPEAFRVTAKLDPERELHTLQEDRVAKANPYIRHCPPELRKRLEELYVAVNAGSQARDSMQQLVRTIIPGVGFSGGCVFTLDPGTMTLVPRLKFGQLSSNVCKVMTYTPLEVSANPVLTAFECSTPIIQNALVSTLGGVCYVAGALGQELRVGVLYLEMPEDLVNTSSTNLLVVFKALRQSVQDCLGLR